MGTTPEFDPDASLMSVGNMDGLNVSPSRDEYPMLSPKDRAEAGVYAVEPKPSIGPDTAKRLRDRLRVIPFGR